MLNGAIDKIVVHFFFQAEDGIRDADVTGVQTCALPIYAFYELLVERVADAVRHAALDLSFDDHWIDQFAAVVDHDVALDFHHRRLGIHFDHHGVHAARGAAAVGAVVGGGLEAPLGAGLDRAAQR